MSLCRWFAADLHQSPPMPVHAIINIIKKGGLTLEVTSAAAGDSNSGCSSPKHKT